MAMTTSRSEFLKKTIRDKKFLEGRSKIVTASPYRAILRRIDQMEINEESGDEKSPDLLNETYADFERDEDQLDMATLKRAQTFDNRGKSNPRFASQLLQEDNVPQTMNTSHYAPSEAGDQHRY